MIDVTQDYDSAAELVWQRIRDFGDLASWMPGVSQCEVTGAGVGAVRRVVLMGGPPVEERLEAFDEANKQFSYAIVSAPGFRPEMNFLATVSVTATDSGSQIRWQAQFEPGNMRPETVSKLCLQAEGMYRMFLQHLSGVLNH